MNLQAVIHYCRSKQCSLRVYVGPNSRAQFNDACSVFIESTKFTVYVGSLADLRSLDTRFDGMVLLIHAYLDEFAFYPTAKHMLSLGCNAVIHINLDTGIATRYDNTVKEWVGHGSCAAA